jgi:hypothetical protein
MSSLEAMIGSLRRMDKLDERAAQLAAPLVEAAIKATASAGTSPDGKAWAPTKAGGRAMPGAAKAVSAKALGNVVRVTLAGKEVFWHYGQRGAPPRPVIPLGGVEPPPVVRAAIDKAIAKAFDEITGGA